MPNEKYDITIIGAGVIGVACAWYLNKAGYSVCIIDKGQAGRGASHANCGLISPSHALPLTMPGVVAKGMKWMLKADSPFYVKPDLNFKKFRWLLKFAGRCNEKDMMQAMIGRKEILDSSRKLYDELFAAEEIDCEWEEQGILFVYKDSKGMHEYEATNKLLNDYDLGATPYSGKELHDFEPALRDDVYGGWHYTMDAHLKPDLLMSEWLRILRDKGVVIKENTEIESMRPEAGKVQCADGEIRTNTIVIATGAWSSDIGKMLGFKIPIQPRKGYSITMSPPKNPVRIPCILQEAKMVVTPFQSAYRLGGTMEFSGFDDSLNPKRLDAIRKNAAEYIKDPEGDLVTEQSCGWRPMTWDGLPIIDQSPAYDNVFIAAGHNMLGLSMAPATGKLITEIIKGDEPHIDARHFKYQNKM